MLTINALREFGANVDEGLERCMRNESFYFRMIRLCLADTGFEKLRTAVESGDNKAAFEAAHALKGVLGNLSLTPIYKPASELTELLRAGTPGDYAGYVTEIGKQLARLQEICAD